MRFSLLILLFLSALAVASIVSDMDFLEERGLILQDRAPRGGSRGGPRTRTSATRTRKVKTKKKTPKKTTPKKNPKKRPKKTSKKTPKKTPKKNPKKNPKKRTMPICGARNSNCGSKRPKKGAKTRSCPIGGGKKKKTSRAVAPVLTRRTLRTEANHNLYVVQETDKHLSSQLDYNFPTGYVFAVSKSGTWTNRPQTIPLTGLEGCTAIAVVSEKGYWISHFMEVTMAPEQENHKDLWKYLIRDVTHGRVGKYTPPHEIRDIFDADAKPKIYISRPKRAGKVLYTAEIHQILAQIRKGPLSSVPIAEEFKYNKMDEKEAKELQDTARGKMLLEYTNDQKKDDQTQSPQQAMYRIWLEDHPHPVSWAALDNQKGSVNEEGKADEKPKPRDEFEKHCLSDASRTIEESDSDQIVAAICNKLFLDLSSPINRAHGDIQISMSMNPNQRGCHPIPASGRKVQRTACRRVVTQALTQCPNPAGGFFGSRPLTWNGNGIGCVDVSVHR